MTNEEMIVYASEKLKKYDIEQSIEIRYQNGVFQTYVMEKDGSEEMFYGDGFTFKEALENLIFSDEGINSLDEIIEDRYKKEQKELDYKNKVYIDKQLYANA